MGRETCEWWSAVCWRSIYKKINNKKIAKKINRRFHMRFQHGDHNLIFC